MNPASAFRLAEKNWSQPYHASGNSSCPICAPPVARGSRPAQFPGSARDRAACHKDRPLPNRGRALPPFFRIFHAMENFAAVFPRHGIRQPPDHTVENSRSRATSYRRTPGSRKARRSTTCRGAPVWRTTDDNVPTRITRRMETGTAATAPPGLFAGAAPTGARFCARWFCKASPARLFPVASFPFLPGRHLG